ncbi:copper transporter [Nocardiopsis sp. FIRDI 009]|uniref:copper transporter n=1 Tax=Nocardiopsis sp. FIRDI 009 TaxID=714197 RepID=UPI000E282386|nr:copper transporter [Nocardiopsis sp. FIRDI 009]
MIDFRYHLVSIVAVFLALTVGLVLGTTMLQDPLLNTLQSETADLRGQSERLRADRDEAERVGAVADTFAEVASEDVLDRRLDGVGVVVVAAPGADGDLVAALTDRIEEADGEVVGRLGLTPDLVDGDKATFVGELAIQVARDPDRLTGGAHDRAGTELGRALARATRSEGDGDDEDRDGKETGAGDEEGEDGDEEGTGDGETEDRTAEAVLAAFAEGGLVEFHGDPAGAADAVVVVAPEFGSEGDSEIAQIALTAFVAALREEVGPTVLAGDVTSAEPGGLIARARAEEPAFTTVDLAGRPMGDVITVLALAASLEGPASSYGVGEGVVGFVPDPLPEPRSSEDDSSERGSDDAEGERPPGEARHAARAGE